MGRVWEYIWHRKLGQPYRLVCTMDVGVGTPVVLLHGIGSFGGVWRHVAQALDGQPYRVMALDLLGFGESPKPDWLEYSVDDHARAVLAALQRQHLGGQPVILVGHSMGALVAVRAARLKPQKVKHLILYEMPVYADLPALRRYTVRRDAYMKLYDYLIHSPHLRPDVGPNIRRAIARFVGLDVSVEMWLPFMKSLQNTIMEQAALRDLRELKMPIDIIYGLLDLLVIRGKPHQVFGQAATNIHTHTIAESHGISRRASRFIAERIVAI